MGSNIFNIEPLPGEKLLYLMPDERRALSVEKGDVLGLYIEDASGSEDDFQVLYQENTTSSMIYAYEVDKPMTLIEPESTPASTVLLDAAPVLTVLLGKLMSEGHSEYEHKQRR